MKQYRSMKTALLAATLMIAVPCQADPKPWTLSSLQKQVQDLWTKHPQLQTPLIITGAFVGATALISLIWWLAQDRRSDEQVVIDTQRLCRATTDKYNRMITVLEEAQLASHKAVNELLLVKLIESGVDSYYLHALNNALSKLNKENDTLSTRIIRTKSDQLCKRMKVMQQDIFALVTRLNGLSSFIHHHIGYIELYKTAATLQETYGQARTCQQSQAELLAYVQDTKSLFTAYPYFDFVEKIERAISSLKSHLHDAAYAQNSELVRDAKILLNDLIVIKGGVASTREYRDDVHKREVARIKLEKEAAELARIRRNEMAALASRVQAEVEHISAQAEQNRIALERQRLDEQKKANKKQAQYLEQQKLDLERAKIATQNEAIQRENARIQQERAAAQQAQYDAWQRAQQAAAYQQQHTQYPEPSALPMEEEPTHNYGYNQTEPSAPPMEEEEDLDALFNTMAKDLEFETRETEQYQNDYSIEDVD